MPGADDHQPETGNRRIIDFFDADYHWWEGVYATTLPRRFFSFEMIRRRALVYGLINRYLAAGGQPRILECGCGPGGILEGLRARNCRLTGVDINLRHLMRGRSEIGQEINWIQADVETLPFPDQTFDVVCCIGVLSYLQEDAPAVAEIARVSKAGGVVIMALPNWLMFNKIFDPYYYLVWMPLRVMRKFFSGDRAATGDPGRFSTDMIRRYRHGKINALFRQHGLVERERRDVSFGPLTLWRHEFLPLHWSMKLSDALLALAQKRGFSLLRHVSNHWITSLEKVSP